MRLAREAAGDKAFVAGAIGPLGAQIEPLGPLSFTEARAIFKEQADALLSAGIDLLVLETFYELNELREAIFAAREAAGSEMVIVAQVTVDDEGSLRDGTNALTFTRSLNEWPVDVIGVNCSAGPKTVLETIEKMAPHTAKPLSAMPNAGLPANVEGRNIYLCSPEYMSQYARRFLQAGVRVIGGCCGTTPEHIKLICSEVRSLQPVQRKTTAAPIVEEGKPPVKPLAKVPVAEKSQLGGEARGREIRRIRRNSSAARNRCFEGNSRGRLCRENGIDCINVPDGPRASARMSAQVTCQLIQATSWNRSCASFLLPRSQYSQHPIGAARRAHDRRAKSHLHHRRSAPDGGVSGRNRGFRRRFHRSDEHRQQSQSGSGYWR